MKRTASITSDLTRQSPGKRKRTTDETSSKAANGFPRWTKGTVWIHLSEDPRHQYQLHKAVLERTSTWFLEELRKNIDHSAKIPVEAPSEGVKFQFVLEQVGDDGELVLVRTVSHKLHSRSLHSL